MDEAFIATILLFAGNYAPRGWAFCNGQTLPIAQNSALFSLLGTTYGGDGTTTFNLPDLRGRVPVGASDQAGPGLTRRAVGEKAGAESVTLTAAQMPAHAHVLGGQPLTFSATLKATSAAGTKASPAGAYLAATNLRDGNGNPLPDGGGGVAKALPYASAATPAVQLAPDAISGTLTGQLTVQPTGGSQPVPVLPPYLGLNYIICLEGIYPPRS